MPSIERAYAAVSLENIRNNVRQISSHIAPGTKIMAVIKADGYGHGAEKIALAVADMEEIWGYAVATATEALEITALGTGKPVLILGYCYAEDYAAMIENDIRFTLFDESSLVVMEGVAASLNKKAYVHIKLDTGMGRIGIRPDDSGLDFVRRVAKQKHIVIEGLFTHFARADESDLTSAKEQLRRYRDFSERLKQEDIPVTARHCANSAAILCMEDTDYDIVRAGIILYGMMPSDEVSAGKVKLTPAMEIRSRVTFVKEVPAGTPISYGGTYVTKRVSRIATVSIGYADGYPRSLSNKGIVLICGKRCPVVGRVCMDQMMVDVTDLEWAVQPGTEVTIVGHDGDEYISMEEFAELSGRINYEAVCDIGKRVPRIYPE